MALHDRILLATDLSARSDRALDRAMMLATREGAELVVLHVIEPVVGNRFHPPKQALSILAGYVRQQLLHDLGDCAAKADVRIEQGDPAEVIERVARELESTIIIVGVARVEQLGRFALGATVERLIREADAPMLIVTDRPRKPYGRVAVTVDLSKESARVLELATEVFPGQRITAFHAYQPMTYGSPDLAVAAAQWKPVAQTNFQDWLASTNLSEDVRARIVPQLEHGDAPTLVREAAEHGNFDLVVIGTRGRGRLSELFIGSIAKQILAELPCDALLVRYRA